MRAIKFRLMKAGYYYVRDYFHDLVPVYFGEHTQILWVKK
jgi:hypothetical protein